MSRAIIAPIGALTLIAGIASAAADDTATPSPESDFEGICSAALLQVRPISADTPQRDFKDLDDTMDCVLADGTALRLRWGADQAFPYGECGAAPPEYVSLWINKRRVLSRHFIGDGCRGLALQNLEANATSVSICTYIPKNRGTRQDVGDDANADYVLPFNRSEGQEFHDRCAVATVDKSAPIDGVEYPGSSSQVVKAGSLQPLRQEDGALCAAAVSADGTKLAIPLGSTPIPWQRWKPSAYGGETRRATFDFLNEGVDHDVYDWDLYTHAQDGETYLVLPKGAPEPDIGVGEYHGDRLPPPSSGRRTDLGYWHGEVFRQDNVSYVLATPVNYKEDLYLWRPLPDGTLHPVCSWHRVERHF
jgi:hypothetical protein